MMMQSAQTSAPLTRQERLRRVVLLCCHFMRNLAYYRVGFSGEPRHPNRDFWVTVNGNFLDQVVLEWCKLLGDERADHHWMRIVSDKLKFERELLQHLNMTAAAFQDYRNEMREYRDKFVAHLDLLREVVIPKFDSARASIEFYHAYVAGNEVQQGDLSSPRLLPTTDAELRQYYDQCATEARLVYGQIDHRPTAAGG
jgi:hypothetical protein